MEIASCFCDSPAPSGRARPSPPQRTSRALHVCFRRPSEWTQPSCFACERTSCFNRQLTAESRTECNGCRDGCHSRTFAGAGPAGPRAGPGPYAQPLRSHETTKPTKQSCGKAEADPAGGGFHIAGANFSPRGRGTLRVLQSDDEPATLGRNHPRASRSNLCATSLNTAFCGCSYRRRTSHSQSQRDVEPMLQRVRLPRVEHVSDAGSYSGRYPWSLRRCLLAV